MPLAAPQVIVRKIVMREMVATSSNVRQRN